MTELMIVIAITSGLSLSIMSMLINSTAINQRARLQAELTRDVNAFFYTLEQYIAQTTQVISCGCNAGAKPCSGNDDLTATAPAGTVFTFAYEDSDDPLRAAGPRCAFAGVSVFPGTNITPLGCKRTMTLTYTPPTAASTAAPSAPGKLVLTDITPPALPSSVTAVIALSSVTDFACGMTTLFNGSPSNADFKMRIDVKVKGYAIENVSDPRYESWAQPTPKGPGGLGAQNFDRGFRRSHMGQVTFRNFTMPGIQFGKLRQYKACVADGSTSPNGMQCCSGYQNASGRCIPLSGCAAANQLANQQLCCSHMANAAGVCL